MNGSDNLWSLMTDSAFGIGAGSGATVASYSGNGLASWAVNLSGLPIDNVNGYPSILYGYTAYGSSGAISLGQPPQFPATLSSMCALVSDVGFALNGTITGGDNGFEWDEYLTPTSGADSGLSGSVEVEIFPYYNWNTPYSGYPGTFVQTFNEPATLNGTTTTIGWLEYVIPSAGQGAGSDILFYPPTSGTMSNFTHGELAVNLLDFLKEGARVSGVGNDWYVAGVNPGTAFGNQSSPDFTFNLWKFEIEQAMVE